MLWKEVCYIHICIYSSHTVFFVPTFLQACFYFRLLPLLFTLKIFTVNICRDDPFILLKCQFSWHFSERLFLLYNLKAVTSTPIIVYPHSLICFTLRTPRYLKIPFSFFYFFCIISLLSSVHGRSHTIGHIYNNLESCHSQWIVEFDHLWHLHLNINYIKFQI